MIRHKAWAVIEDINSKYKYGWVIYLRSKNNGAQIANLRWYTTTAGAKKACLIWAKRLGLQIDWRKGLKEADETK